MTKKVTALLIGIMIIGLFYWISRINQDSLVQVAKLDSNEIVQTCTTDMATQYHIHPKLRIIIDGVQQNIPTGIGVKPECMNPVHTHESDGTVHVESPIKVDFTLGDFFTIWGKTFNQNQILDSVVSADTRIIVTVNGQVVDTYENTILDDKDEIIINYTK